MATSAPLAVEPVELAFGALSRGAESFELSRAGTAVVIPPLESPSRRDVPQATPRARQAAQAASQYKSLRVGKVTIP